MKIKTVIATALAVLPCLAACKVDGVFAETEPLLEVGQRITEVSPEAADDTVWVRSNRSWSVVVDDPQDWISVVTEEHLNLSQKTEETPLIVRTEANPVKLARTATFKVVSGNLSQTFYVKQTELVYTLAVKGDLVRDGIDGEGGTQEVSVVSNAPWTVSIKDGGTAELTLSATSGSGNGKITVTIAKNPSMSETRTGTIVFEAEDCDPVEVVFNQKSSAPYVSHTLPAENSLYVNAEVFSALPSSRFFSVQSNAHWTAAVSPESTATGIELPVTSGDGPVERFVVNVKNSNTDFANAKTVVIVFTPDGGEPYKVEMTQSKGSILTLEVKAGPNEESKWIFDEEQPGDVAAVGSLHLGGYAFGYKCSSACKLHTAGWQLGTGGDNYVEFPAIAEHKLKRVTFIEANASPAPSIVTTENAVVPGGEQITYAKLVRTSFNLTGTEVNTPYRMIVGTNKTFRFAFLEIEYE